MLYSNTPNIKLIHNEENYGFAMGMNIGVLNSSHDYIILLNNDTIVSKDWLYPLVKPLILNDYGIGSPITNNCGNEVKQFIYFTNIEDLLLKSNALQKQNMFKVCEIDRVPFFCPVLRKKDFFEVGMLDINYKFGGWEDDDLIHKLKIYNNNKQNYYTFGSFVYHIESLTMTQISKTLNWTKNNKNQMYFETKWNTKWIPPKYNISNININIKSDINWIHQLIKTSKISNQIIFRICDKNTENINNVIIIKDTNSDEILDNEIIINNDKENNIVLKNKFENCILYKEECATIKIYSFINTTLILINDNYKPKINYFTIYGERNSGTSILTEYLKTNLNIKFTTCFGHKHFFGHNKYLNTNNVLFIAIIRDPILWINSFFKNPFHIPSENLINIESFLFNKFYSVYESGEIIPEDFNYITKQKYKNIFEMRDFKNNYLINILPKKVKNYYFLKLEDFNKNPEKILNDIVIKFNLSKKNNTKNDVLLYTRGDKTGGNFTGREITLNDEIIQIIKNNLNFEQEHLLGYL